MSLHGQQKALWKSSPVEIGSEHACIDISVAISWGNTIHFTLCVNMAGFSSDSYIH